MERSTRPRHSIRSALADAGGRLLPAEILQAAQAEVPALGLATVYRNLMAGAAPLAAVVLVSAVMAVR
jgi:Fur family ferric uptake transcriptional regulator